MYAVITGPRFWKEIEQVIHDTGEEILFQEIDTEIDLAAELEKVSRIAVKYLILDTSAVADQNRLTQAIMNYKIKRERTRIIIICPNALPGNPTMSFLFSLGIWDFINPIGEQGEELTIREALTEHLEMKEPSYQKGVKWFTGSQENANSQVAATREKGKSDKDTPERTLVIEKGKILGTVVIAVAGTMNRIGNTHTAISLAKYLKDLNFNVAVMELVNSEHFTFIRNSYEDVKIDGNMFTLDDIDYYPYNNNLNVLDVIHEEYNYLILDMGIYNEKSFNMDEFKRAYIRIIVSGVKDWEYSALEKILHSDDWIFKNKYYFTFAEKATFDMVVANMDKLQCYQAPNNPNPFKAYKECAAVFKEMLKEALPEVKQTESKSKPNILKFINKKLGRGEDVEA